MMHLTRITWTLAIALGLVLLAPSLPKAHAGINQDALDELMAGFEFGMTRKQVLRQIKAEVKARYDKKIFATSDVYQQDKLRRERDQEYDRIRGSFVEFDGKIAGWDVSVIDDQFVHNTGESMLVYWENPAATDDRKKQRRFLFFHDNKLYKMVVTLDAGAIAKKNRQYGLFRTALERQYGPARDSEFGASWVDNGLILFALDKLAHYDTVCLAVTDMKMSRDVIALRAQREQKVEKRSPIIRAMIGGEGEVDLEKSQDTIDRILDDNNKKKK
ncbi:hypothetical protein [Haliangium ochraceum]|uniref:Uncharacterized protein n=1 Tax=Haliangium ochraceum (strain DSM 14365 / JCM 11303 / SMP-2) TaxID=502025 RepID=D0LY64_HALO1|nr:hypothetical protein [Haliangium ochraceum]ACY16214.1 hypothetical protein Hoch_3714 [Haliangium ochraceum DSM 14365]